MIAYPPSDVPRPGQGGRPGPAKALWNSDFVARCKEFAAAKDAGDLPAMEQAAMAVSAELGAPHPIPGFVQVRPMAWAAAETGVFGKPKSGMYVSIEAFDGGIGSDGRPSRSVVQYGVTRDTASGMAKRFVGTPDGERCAVSPVMDKFHGCDVPAARQTDYAGYIEPVRIASELMLQGQNPDPGGVRGAFRDVDGCMGPVRLRASHTVTPFLSSDAARSGMAKAQQAGIIMGSPNTSAEDWLGSSGFPGGHPKRPNTRPGTVDKARAGAGNKIYSILVDCDMAHDELEALGVAIGASYSEGKECQAVYVDVTKGKLPEAMNALERICRSGDRFDDFGIVKDLTVKPVGVDWTMAFSGKAPASGGGAPSDRLVVPVMFSTSAEIEASPYGISVAAAACKDRSLAEMAYSESVRAMANFAGRGQLQASDLDAMRDSVRRDAQENIAYLFGLEDVQPVDTRDAMAMSKSIPGGMRDPAPTEKMVARNASALEKQLGVAREALRHSSTAVTPGMSWTDVKPAGGPEFKR